MGDGDIEKMGDSVKRDLLQCQKRPTTVSKETLKRWEMGTLKRCTDRERTREREREREREIHLEPDLPFSPVTGSIVGLFWLYSRSLLALY